MLTLTRTRRQALATLVVLAGFVAPSGYVAKLAWDVRRPEHVRRVERELSGALGLEVSLGGVSYPRPGETLLRHVVLRQADGGIAGSRPAEIVRAESLRLVRRSAQITIEADGLTLRADGPRAALGQVVALLARPGGEGRSINFLAHSCSIVPGGGRGRATVGELVGTVRRDQARPSVSASCRIGQGSDAPRCELTLTRDRRSEPVRTSLVLKTLDGAPLPAAVLDPFFASAAWLGDSARVEGELTLNQEGAEDWGASFRGALTDVDLSALVGRLAPENRLTGRATVRVENARWADQPGRGPGWVEGQGTVVAGEGTIGGELLGSLRSQLGFRLGERAEIESADLDFRALGLRFDFDESGAIHLAGGLGPEHRPGAVLVGGPRRGPLLLEPAQPVGVAALIRALVPGDPARPDALIPARFESLLMQRHLPAPRGDMGP